MKESGVDGVVTDVDAEHHAQADVASIERVSENATNV
jgi:hypothetical protein